MRLELISSLNKDLPHVLSAIIEGLDFCLEWPDVAKRAQLANKHPGTFNGCDDIMHVTEVQCKRPCDATAQRDTWSTEKGIGGGHNDREVWTECPHYLQEGDYFSVGEKVAADGSIKGDGPPRDSLDNLGADPAGQLYNVAFQEVWKYKENNYRRLKKWFPILGRRRRTFDRNKKIFMLTIHACFRLTKWLMRNRNLQYDPAMNSHQLFQGFYKA
ncbi:hypothetical protein B484DRAFT_397819 [Ochromonadaceae sp. CCMP2298]|nr:hypothetical protein B484DRAFT_397819 [Ochromonadaceae sp. CCMP2298]